MNREQFRALLVALEQISPPSRQDAVERAMRVLDGKATFDEAFGPAWGESTWGKATYGGSHADAETSQP